MRTGIATARRLGVKVLTAEHVWGGRTPVAAPSLPSPPSPPFAFLSCGSYDAVRVYCARCPVSEECADAGRSEEYGMWGGKSPHERPRRRRPSGRVGTQGHEDLSPAPPTPCPNRPEVCRRGGCCQPALGQVICLCAGHLLTYEIEAKRTLELVRKPLPAAAPRGT